MVKEIDIQVQEAQRVPNKWDPKRTTPRHIIIKIPKAKDTERILKAAREKQRVIIFSVYNAHFFAQIFEGKIRMCIIHGYHLKDLVSVLVFYNYLLHKISCTKIC